MNRQSKDFNEVLNIQTDMKVDAEKWDKIFHNWEHPENCIGRKKVPMCTVCSILDTGTPIKHLDKTYQIVNQELQIF